MYQRSAVSKNGIRGLSILSSRWSFLTAQGQETTTPLFSRLFILFVIIYTTPLFSRVFILFVIFYTTPLFHSYSYYFEKLSVRDSKHMCRHIMCHIKGISIFYGFSATWMLTLLGDFLSPSYYTLFNLNKNS